MSGINLSKIEENRIRLQKEGDSFVELDSKAGSILQKSGLQSHTARVALCLDISGSMSSLYRSGKIQALIEKLLTLAVRFDEDGSIDVFSFGSDAHVEESVNIQNFRGYTDRLLKSRKLEGGTNYGRAIALLRKSFFPHAPEFRNSPESAGFPIYVMFITDGQTQDEEFARRQIQAAAYEPVFWQFMAIGKSKKDVKASGGGFFAKLMASDFGFLESLDTMSERYIDNANFFSVQDPGLLDDESLYALLMKEYPDWLIRARAKGLVRS